MERPQALNVFWIPFAVGLAAAGSPAAADECDALAVAISGATYLKAGKRVADEFLFDAGRDEVMLTCFAGRIELSFAYNTDNERFPPPVFLLSFSRAAESISRFDSSTVLYKKAIACLQAAARDKAGEAQVNISDRFHYVSCSTSGPWPSTDHHWPRIAYHDDHVMDRPE